MKRILVASFVRVSPFLVAARLLIYAAPLSHWNIPSDPFGTFRSPAGLWPELLANRAPMFWPASQLDVVCR